MSNGGPNINKLVNEVTNAAGEIVSSAVSGVKKVIKRAGHRAGKKVKGKKYDAPRVTPKHKTKGQRQITGRTTPGKVKKDRPR